MDYRGGIVISAVNSEKVIGLESARFDPHRSTKFDIFTCHNWPLKAEIRKLM